MAQNNNTNPRYHQYILSSNFKSFSEEIPFYMPSTLSYSPSPKLENFRFLQEKFSWIKRVLRIVTTSYALYKKISTCISNVTVTFQTKKGTQRVDDFPSISKDGRKY